MAIQVTFNKPNGFITVVNGSRTWVISKEEAKNVFVTADETCTLKRDIVSLFAVLITLVPIERIRKLKYRVKIVTKTGKEVELFNGGNVDLAYYMVERILDFSKKSQETEEKESRDTQKAYQVESEKSYVGFWIRLVAFLIDYIIVIVPMTIGVLIIEASTGIDIGQGVMIIFPPIHFVYCVAFWTWRGQTPGKIALGVRIVKSDGSNIGIGQSILRYIGYIISAAILYIGYFMIAWESNKQGLHDMIASTYVEKTS